MRDAQQFIYGIVLGVSASFGLHNVWWGHFEHGVNQVMLGSIIVLAMHGIFGGKAK